MNHKKINKNYIKNLFLNVVEKKGYSNISKNLILNSSVNLYKHNKNVYKLFEKTIKNSVLPFKIKKNKNKYNCKYNTIDKSISDFIGNIINCIRNTKKRISFDFYFKNEMYKMLQNINYVNEKKQNLINLYNNVDFIKSTLNKKFDKNTKLIIQKQNKIKFIYDQINICSIYKYNNIIYSYKKKYKKVKNSNNFIIENKIKNINFI